MQNNLIKWTPQAIHCFERNCICNGCIIDMIMETKCNMKNLIPFIVEQCGEPSENKILVNEDFNNGNI